MENSTKPQLRSTSLPCRLTPSSSLIEINVNKIQTLVPFCTSTSIHRGLVCLADLYLSVDILISSSQIQQVNLQQRNKSLIEGALFSSTQLLDSCSKILELLAVIKENVRKLQFGLRRKGVGIDANCTEAHISDYFQSRKKVKKSILECLRSLEMMEVEKIPTLVADENHHLSMVIGVLKEIVVATISVFRALLICLSSKTKPEKGFSLVAKLMPIGRSSCDKSGQIISDLDNIDVTLRSLSKNIMKNESKAIEVQMVTKRLQNLDRQIEGYEFGLDSVFRKLIQTRVSLLNILTH